MDALTLDQFLVLATVVDEGSFSAAARKLNRAQSAITYAIQKLEEQTGIELFDRTAYRPRLSDAGRSLMPRVRRILEDVATFRTLALGISGGLEAELALVIDYMVPIALLATTLKEFHTLFPSVRLHIARESVSAAIRALLDGTVVLGIVADFRSPPELECRIAFEMKFVAVAAPSHPLAQITGAIEPEVLREHMQLVLTDRSEPFVGGDFGVVAENTWRLADIAAKHTLLRAGLGWGSMPDFMVEADLAAHRLVVLHPKSWQGLDIMPQPRFVTAHRRDKALGPAGRWIFDRLRKANLDIDNAVLTSIAEEAI